MVSFLLGAARERRVAVAILAEPANERQGDPRAVNAFLVHDGGFSVDLSVDRLEHPLVIVRHFRTPLARRTSYDRACPPPSLQQPTAGTISGCRPRCARTLAAVRRARLPPISGTGWPECRL